MLKLFCFQNTETDLRPCRHAETDASLRRRIQTQRGKVIHKSLQKYRTAKSPDSGISRCVFLLELLPAYLHSVFIQTPRIAPQLDSTPERSIGALWLYGLQFLSVDCHADLTVCVEHTAVEIDSHFAGLNRAECTLAVEDNTPVGIDFSAPVYNSIHIECDRVGG